MKTAFVLLLAIANDYTDLDSAVPVAVVPAESDVTRHPINDVEADQAAASLRNIVMSRSPILRLCCQANLLKMLEEQNSPAILTWF